MSTAHYEIKSFLYSYLDSERVQGVVLPDFLRDPKTEAEVNDRFYFLFHKLSRPLCVLLSEELKRNVSKAEREFISENVQTFLKGQGF